MIFTGTSPYLDYERIEICLDSAWFVAGHSGWTVIGNWTYNGMDTYDGYDFLE